MILAHPRRWLLAGAVFLVQACACLLEPLVWVLLLLLLLLGGCVHVHPVSAPERGGLPEAFSHSSDYGKSGVRCWSQHQPLDRCLRTL